MIQEFHQDDESDFQVLVQKTGSTIQRKDIKYSDSCHNQHDYEAFVNGSKHG
jgi:hypothetical protein